MIWLTVRQYRIHIVVILAVAVLLAIALVVAADYTARVRAELGVDTCVPLPNTNINCADLTAAWQKRVMTLNYLFYSLYVLPGLVASYVGGPLFAVEFERGTHRVAWTQGISRVRWAAVKLGVVLLVTLAAGAVLAPFGGEQRVFSGTFGSAVSRFETFEIEGLALVSYFVFGLAAGAFVGAWSRRIITGMFIGLLVFGAVRVGVHNLRPAYLQPETAPFPSCVAPPCDLSDPMPSDGWALGVKGFDFDGRQISDERLMSLQLEFFNTHRGPYTATNNDTTFLRERGVIRRMLYQPAERFWTFQAIEAAIFTGLAALFALLTLWRVRSRDA
jgi:hypothetical protein